MSMENEETKEGSADEMSLYDNDEAYQPFHDPDEDV